MIGAFVAARDAWVAVVAAALAQHGKAAGHEAIAQVTAAGGAAEV